MKIPFAKNIYLHAFFNDMNNPRPSTYIAFVSAMLLWSFSFIWSKQAFQVYEPLTVLTFRLGIAAVSLVIIAKVFGLLQKIKKGDFKLLILLSFFEPFLYFIGENLGLQYVSPTIAAVMISMIPLGMPFIGKYFFNEKISPFNIFGLIVSISGVLLIILEQDFKLDAHPIGIALLLLAVISALAYTAVLKNITNKYNAFTIVSWQNIFATIGFVPLFLIFDYQHFTETGFQMEGMKFIILLALVASNGAFILYTIGLKNLGVAKAGVFTNLIPIFTAIISFFVFNEHLNLIKYIGIIVVVLGLMLSQLSFGRKK